MNQKLRKEIEELRKCGLGYGKIASALNITKTSVASYCRRYNLSKEETLDNEVDVAFCKECEKIIYISEGHRHKVFCSSYCKNKYWNKYHEELNKKSLTLFKCCYFKKECKSK